VARWATAFRTRILAGQYGKVLRLNEDGKLVPNDNPFVGRDARAFPEIYLGHRESSTALKPFILRPGSFIRPKRLGDRWGQRINRIKAGPGTNGWPLYG